MPDALSKTVPIWCAVLNRTLFPSNTWSHNVNFPPDYLGASEQWQIEQRIDGFVKSLHHLRLNLDDLRAQLGKPIRVAWANQSYFYPADLCEGAKGEGYNLLVLCSASKRVRGAEMSEGGYVQGAGDDSEGWAHGLTAPVFWANRGILLDAAEADLPALIEQLMEQSRQQDRDQDQSAILIAPTRNIFISRRDHRFCDRYDFVIDCNGAPEDGTARQLNLGCGSSKLGSRDLRKSLDKVQSFIDSRLQAEPSSSLLVMCESGKDLSAGAALAILCLYYSDDGIFFFFLSFFLFK